MRLRDRLRRSRTRTVLTSAALDVREVDLQRQSGRVAHDAYWLDGSHRADPLGVDALTAADLPRLLESPNHLDRCRAYVLLDRLRKGATLPDGTWTVYSTYRDGWGGPGRKAIWSAHETEADARRWHAAYRAFWEEVPPGRSRPRRSDYDMQVARLDGIHVQYLRHAGADPNLGLAAHR